MNCNNCFCDVLSASDINYVKKMGPILLQKIKGFQHIKFNKNEGNNNNEIQCSFSSKKFR